MKIALQPSANRDAQKHYIDTVQNKVKLSSIKKFISDTDYDALAEIYPDGNVLIWGVTPTNKSKWNKIDDGKSVSLFYKNKVFFSQALITKKIHNKKLALDLWGTDDKGNTWEYIYFLDEILPLALDIKTFNKVVGYADNFVLQGFNVLDGEKADSLYTNIDEFEELDSEIQDSKEEYVEIVDKQFKGSLDSQSKGVSRKEQGYLRNKLFGKKHTAQCALCHNEIPVKMLVAGHIKKRSKCTREEKLDAENIVMSICKFGCDDLFEKGYVLIDENGKIYSSGESIVTPFVEVYINNLVEKKCLKHNSETETYFKWHREFHESMKIKTS
ncbi:MAG: HNH endonuclease [Sulfurovum sp.]|nr:HNH endonuclease [Sulfurovum sp.]